VAVASAEPYANLHLDPEQNLMKYNRTRAHHIQTRIIYSLKYQHREMLQTINH